MDLTAEQLQQNYETFIKILNDEFSGERLANLLAMYSDLEERLMFAPASGAEHYHNAFQGGYLDHVLRVYEFTKQVYGQWVENGGDVSNYTYEELMFSAINHDLGKLGFPGDGNETYKPNESKWHRENQGKLYSHNKDNPYANINDLSIWLLQHYNLKATWNESIAIKLTDGIYDDANKQYYMTRAPEATIKNNMPFILHQADMMASRIEYEMWRNNEKSKPIAITKPKFVKPVVTIPNTSAQTMFDSIFEETND